MCNPDLHHFDLRLAAQLAPPADPHGWSRRDPWRFPPSPGARSAGDTSRRQRGWLLVEGLPRKPWSSPPCLRGGRNPASAQL